MGHSVLLFVGNHYCLMLLLCNIYFVSSVNFYLYFRTVHVVIFII